MFMKIQLPFIFALFVLASCGGDGADVPLAGGASSAADAVPANVPGNCSGDVTFDVDVSDVPEEEPPVVIEPPVDDGGDDGDNGVSNCTPDNLPCIGNPAISRSAKVKVQNEIQAFMAQQGYGYFRVSETQYNPRTKTVIVAGCGGTVVVDNSSTNISPTTNVNTGGE